MLQFDCFRLWFYGRSHCLCEIVVRVGRHARGCMKSNANMAVLMIAQVLLSGACASVKPPTSMPEWEQTNQNQMDHLDKPIIQRQKPIFDQMLDGMLVDAIDAITR